MLQQQVNMMEAKNREIQITFYSIPINPQTPKPNQQATLVTGNKPLFL